MTIIRIAPEHRQFQPEIDACLECVSPDCVYVDPVIDERWCELNPNSGVIRPVPLSERRKTSRPTKKYFERAKALISSGLAELSFRDFAAKSGINEATLYRWKSAGYLKTRETEDGNYDLIVGIDEPPKDTVVTFCCRKIEDEFRVIYRTARSNPPYAYQSANPYLAIAAIAMELAKQYAD